MPSEKKLYRSRNSWLGGVCSGIAEYFNIDPIIVQILTVVFTITTAGTLIIVYVALWIILPKAPDLAAPVEVQPHEVRSDTYGQVIYQATSVEGESFMPESNSQKTNPYEPQVNSANIPPRPPEAYPGNQVQQNPASPSTSPTTSSAGGALWFGLILLFIGICALLGAFVGGVKWWQFWPLVFVIMGIGQMVVPAKKGHRMNHFVNGLITFSFGAAALPFSLGTLSLASLEPIFINLWPVLIIMCGLLVLGGALKFPIFTLLAGFCFLAFCIIGLLWFGIPGSTDLLTFTWPSGEIFSYDINPWIDVHGN